MTPERLEQIRAAIAEKPVGELEHVLPELLAEVDRLRGIFVGQASALTKVYAGIVSPPDEFEGETDASVLHDGLVMRLRAFEAFVHERRDTYEQMAQRDECDFPVDSHAFAAMQMAFNEVIVRGLELGLWED